MRQAELVRCYAFYPLLAGWQEGRADNSRTGHSLGLAVCQKMEDTFLTGQQGRQGTIRDEVLN